MTTPDNDSGLTSRIKRKMFEMGMPVGSDRPDLQQMGAPPLHLCNPDEDCAVCAEARKPHA